MGKLTIWKEDWESANTQWDVQAKEAAKQYPLKGLQSLPNMVGITKETARFLKWKSLKWMIQKDHKGEIRKGFLKHPFKYGLALLKSMVQKKPYLRDGDFFLYGIKTIQEFGELLKNSNTLFVIGFSYCHKPFECPSGRFTPDCSHDANHPTCQQCFIGKCMNASKNGLNVFHFLIPTIHYIGGKIFEIAHKYPGKQILFIITACEMTLEMFGDWGNMVGIKGLGVRLDGRICNTMKSFELSENGIKPGLTVVLDKTQQVILDLIRQRICH